MLIAAHGKTLIEQMHSENARAESAKLEISSEQAMDAEQIALGGFSPLRGFLTQDQFESVAKNARLIDGTAWPLPIILQIPKVDFQRLQNEKQIDLVEKGTNFILGLLEVQEFYRIKLDDAAKNIFGTNDHAHPGVREFERAGEFVVAGSVHLVERRHSPFKVFELTPAQTRAEFESRHWSCVVGFHTRNAIHRSHEAAQLLALERVNADGLFVHPVVGKKKSGDFLTEVIIDSYEQMIKSFYPAGKVLFSTFASYSRYAGPREALFTALCRQNYGCSHFIVGRDHTGVGNFYAHDASQKIFEQFPDILIKPILLPEIAFSKSLDKYIELNEQLATDVQRISGTKLREMIEKGEQPPAWFMRPEISARIIEKIALGEKVFVE